MKKQFVIFITIIFCLFFSVLRVSASDNLHKTETKDKVIFIKDNNGRFKYSWSFDKKSYKNNQFDFDLGIKFQTESKDKINKIIKDNLKKEYISFNYHGTLPSKATIKVPVNKNFKDDDVLKLYYYNDKTNNIEFVNNNVKVINGYVSFDIDHCSDYFLTLSIVKEAKGNNNSNSTIIIGMIFVIVFLVGYTLFNNRK